MSNAPDPKVFSAVHHCIVAESMDDAVALLQVGTPLYGREYAEMQPTEIEASTGRRHYIFTLDIRIQQVTS